MTPQEALVDGMAGLLATAGLAWRPDGSAYADDEIGVHRFELPPTGAGVALAVYSEEIVDRSSMRYFVQARIRGDQDLSELVRAALSWRQHPPMPAGIDVVQITPRGYADLGRSAGVRLVTRNFSALT